MLIEQFVVVGDKGDAAKAAALWRFLPKAFKTYYNMPDPAAIEERAGAELRSKRYSPIGRSIRIRRSISRRFRNCSDSGATIVNVHSGQADQHKVIDFYRRSVSPEIAQTPTGIAH